MPANERSRQMEIFAPYLLCALFLAAMYGAARLAFYLSNHFARRSVYKSGIYTAKTVHTLFLARFGSKNVISGRFLPRITERGTVYDSYDHILLLKGEVTIVTVCREDGKIHNPSFSETWTARVRTRYGSERELDFENPIAVGSRKKEALAKIFENAKCRFPIPIRHIVIFPSRRVSFSLPRQQEIMSPPEAMRTLEGSNKATRFTKEQTKRMKRAIAHFSRSESQIQAKKAKRRHR